MQDHVDYDPYGHRPVSQIGETTVAKIQQKCKPYFNKIETRRELSCSALPAAKRFLLFPSGEWRVM